MFRTQMFADVERCELAVAGEVDLAAAPQILVLGRAALRDAAAAAALVVDLADVTFLDSTGLGALVALRNTAHALGKDVVLSRVPDRVQRMFTLSGLDTVFEFEPRYSPVDGTKITWLRTRPGG